MKKYIKLSLIVLSIGASINAAEDFNALAKETVRADLIALLDPTHQKATLSPAAAHLKKTCKNTIETMNKADFIEKNSTGEKPLETLNDNLIKILTECINPRKAALKNIKFSALFEETAIPPTENNINLIKIGMGSIYASNAVHASYIQGLINTMALSALVARKISDDLHTFKPIMASLAKSLDTRITDLNTQVTELDVKFSKINQQAP
jgi:hypothetical protein